MAAQSGKPSSSSSSSSSAAAAAACDVNKYRDRIARHMRKEGFEPASPTSFDDASPGTAGTGSSDSTTDSSSSTWSRSAGAAAAAAGSGGGSAPSSLRWKGDDTSTSNQRGKQLGSGSGSGSGNSSSKSRNIDTSGSSSSYTATRRKQQDKDAQSHSSPCTTDGGNHQDQDGRDESDDNQKKNVKNNDASQSASLLQAPQSTRNIQAGNFNNNAQHNYNCYGPAVINQYGDGSHGVRQDHDSRKGQSNRQAGSSVKITDDDGNVKLDEEAKAKEEDEEKGGGKDKGDDNKHDIPDDDTHGRVNSWRWSLNLLRRLIVAIVLFMALLVGGIASVLYMSSSSSHSFSRTTTSLYKVEARTSHDLNGAAVVAQRVSEYSSFLSSAEASLPTIFPSNADRAVANAALQPFRGVLGTANDNATEQTDKLVGTLAGRYCAEEDRVKSALKDLSTATKWHTGMAKGSLLQDRFSWWERVRRRWFGDPNPPAEQAYKTHKTLEAMVVVFNKSTEAKAASSLAGNIKEYGKNGKGRQRQDSQSQDQDAKSIPNLIETLKLRTCLPADVLAAPYALIQSATPAQDLFFPLRDSAGNLCTWVRCLEANWTRLVDDTEEKRQRIQSAQNKLAGGARPLIAALRDDPCDDDGGGGGQGDERRAAAELDELFKVFREEVTSIIEEGLES